MVIISVFLAITLIALAIYTLSKMGKNKVSITYEELKQYEDIMPQDLWLEYFTDHFVNDKMVFEIEYDALQSWRERLEQGDTNMARHRKKFEIADEHANQGDIKQAEQQYLKIINENVNAYGAYTALWRLYRKHKMIAEEIFILNAMLEQFPNAGKHLITTWNYRLQELLFSENKLNLQ